MEVKMDIEHKVYHWPNGNTHRELWFSNNVLHRIDGPAEICYNESGIIGEEYWLITGKYNREDGPAIILYSIDSLLLNCLSLRYQNSSLLSSK